MYFNYDCSTKTSKNIFKKYENIKTIENIEKIENIWNETFDWFETYIMFFHLAIKESVLSSTFQAWIS